jgi:hypothetical protein
MFNSSLSQNKKRYYAILLHVIILNNSSNRTEIENFIKKYNVSPRELDKFLLFSVIDDCWNSFEILLEIKLREEFNSDHTPSKELGIALFYLWYKDKLSSKFFDLNGIHPDALFKYIKTVSERTVVYMQKL